MKPQANLMEMCASKFKSFKNLLYTHYGENPGKMLVHTGVLGWILSSAAQVTAVVFNDKISSKEKVFLIPQELADAAVNIVSFYVVTNSFKALGSKLVKTGKLRTGEITKYLEKNKLTDKIGKIDFDITSQSNYASVKDAYKSFQNGIDVIFSTVGSIISCNLITPVLRNQYAARKQKEILASMKKPENEQNQSLVQKTEIKPLYVPLFQKPITISDYQKNASMKFSGNMKI